MVVYKFVIQYKRKVKKEENHVEASQGSIEETAKKEKAMSRSAFEMTACVSVELLKKVEFSMSKQANLTVQNRRLIDHTDEKNYRGDDEIRDQSLFTTKKNLDALFSRKSYTNDGEDILEGVKQVMSTVPNQARKLSNINETFNFPQNSSMLNFVNELKALTQNENNTSYFNMPQNSIYLPVITNDLDGEIKIGFDDAGYNSSEEDEFKLFPNILITKEIEKQISNRLAPSDPTALKNESSGLDTNSFTMNEQVPLCSKEELQAYLVINPNKRRQSIKTTFRVINNQEEIEIIPEELILVLFDNLYNELNTGLIELSDNFTEERRRYFKVDKETYISVIELFLRKKDEYFLAVLSELMHRLNISQVLLDNTLVYYMNHFDQTEKDVIRIREAYNKVYKAGIKQSIAPKVLTKNRIKEILAFQVEEFRTLTETHKTLSPEAIEIMVIDNTYEEFGYEKEAIRSAVCKFKNSNDESFEAYLHKIEEYKENSFLNI